jgi:hypothetical protein
MKLTLQPNGGPAYGQTESNLFVELPDDEKAVLERVNEGTWRLIIHRGQSRSIWNASRYSDATPRQEEVALVAPSTSLRIIAPLSRQVAASRGRSIVELL